ncbi:MAG: phage tail length tape measure family protein [Proteobacteria bacterium]|nr:phage tail length tape measure family protein [Pseudomonadota bacterium]
MAGDLQLALRITADTNQASAALKDTSAQLDQVGASAKNASTGANAYTRQMSAQLAATTQATAATRDANAALALMAKIDPAGNKLNALDALEKELGRLHKAGAIGAADFEHLGGILTAQRGKLVAVGEGAAKAGAGMHTFSLNTSMARREMGRIGADIAQGNWGRMEQSALTLANATGLLAPLFTATGAAIAGVAVVVAAYFAAVAAGEAQQEALERALIITGNAAGTTTSQLAGMRDNIGRATGQYGAAQQALVALAQAGTITGKNLGDLARVAVNLSQLTGESADKAATELAKLGDDASRTILALNDKYHFLTTATYEQIRALQDQGREEEAVRVATEALAQTTDSAVAQMKSHEGTLVSMWHNVAEAIGGAKQALLDLGRTDAQYQLDKVREKLEQAHNAGLVRYDSSAGVNHYVLTQAGQNAFITERMAVDQALRQEQQLRATIDQADAQAKITGEYQRQNKLVNDATAAARDQTSEAQKRLALLGAQTEVKKTQVEIDQGRLRYATPDAQRAALAAAAAIDAKQAQLDAARGGGRSSGLGIDRAQLSADVQAFQTAWQTATRTFANAERTLESLRKADGIDDRAYFQAKREDIDGLLAAQLKALEAEKAVLPAHVKTAAEKIRVDQQVADIEAKIQQAKDDADAKRQQLDDQQMQLAHQREAEWSQLQQEYLTAIGDPAAAQLLRIEEAFKRTLKDMELAGNDEGQIIAEKLFDVQKAQNQLAKIESAAELAFSAMGLASQEASADAQAGLISELTARQRVIDVNLKYAASLREAAVQAQALAQQTGNPQDILHAAELAEKIRELTLVTSALGEQVQGTFSQSFSQFLQNLATGAQNLRQAFMGLLQSIAAGLARIAADDLSQKLFERLHSVFQPGSSGGAGAPQLAAAAGATTAAGATIQLGATTLEAASVTLGGSAAALLAAAEALAAANATGGAGGGGDGSALSSLFSAGKLAMGFMGMATGGEVHGPGSETSDSIFARLSRGEYVHNAAAVRHYGTGMMAAINQRRYPRFATGGLVDAHMPAGFGAGGGVAQSLRVVCVFDPNEIPNAMAGARGEQVFMAHAKANVPTLRQYVGAAR